VQRKGDFQLEPMDESDLRALGPRAFSTVEPPRKMVAEREVLPTGLAGASTAVTQAAAATVRQVQGLAGDVVSSSTNAIEGAKEITAQAQGLAGGLVPDSVSTKTGKEGEDSVAFRNPLADE
jgi:hypothetical protein